MRNTIKFSSMVLFLGALLLTACEEDSPISDVVPKASVVFNDNINTISGTYVVSGMVNIKVSVSDGVTSVNVSSRYTPGGATSPKIYSLGSVPVSGGVANFSKKARELYDPADEQDDFATALGAGKVRPTGSFVLIFDAVLSGGATERRLFTATINNSIAFAAFSATAPTINPATSFNDSTITLRFTAQNPATARVTNIKVYRRIGEGAEEVTPIIDKNYAETGATFTDNLSITIPPQGSAAGQVPVYTGANYTAATPASRAIRYRLELTSDVGEKTIQNTAYTVTNTGVPLPLVRSITRGSLDANNRWDLSALLGTEVDADADIKITATGSGFDRKLDLGVGTGNTTQFVRLNTTFNYAGATFNSVRDVYNAGTPTTSVANLVQGDIIAVRVGDLIDANAFKNRSSYKIFRVTAMQVNTSGAASTIANEFVTFEYKSVD